MLAWAHVTMRVRAAGTAGGAPSLGADEEPAPSDAEGAVELEPVERVRGVEASDPPASDPTMRLELVERALGAETSEPPVPDPKVVFERAGDAGDNGRQKGDPIQI